MIKAVVFDCFGVLYNDILKDLLKSHHINDPEILSRCFEAARASDVGTISVDTFITELSHLTAIPYSAVRAGMTDTSHLNVELADIIRGLKHEYKIGMITDINAELLEPFLANQDIRSLFDIIVISSEARRLKPQKEIFELAARRLDVAYSEIIFIDNSPANVDAASELGVTAILYRNNQQFKHDFHLFGERKEH